MWDHRGQGLLWGNWWAQISCGLIKWTFIHLCFDGRFVCVSIARMMADVGGSLICILWSRCQSRWTRTHKVSMSNIQNRNSSSCSSGQTSCTEKHWCYFSASHKECMQWAAKLQPLRLLNIQRGSQSQLTSQIPLLWHRKTWVDKAGVKSAKTPQSK